MQSSMHPSTHVFVCVCQPSKRLRPPQNVGVQKKKRGLRPPYPFYSCKRFTNMVIYLAIPELFVLTWPLSLHLIPLKRPFSRDKSSLITVSPSPMFTSCVSTRRPVRPWIDITSENDQQSRNIPSAERAHIRARDAT